MHRPARVRRVVRQRPWPRLDPRRERARVVCGDVRGRGVTLPATEPGSDARQVAALFVAPDGPYAASTGVELWTAERDARRYAGPYPVVAHPPCARWGRMWWLGPRGRDGRGEDGGCFAAALAAVERWGGILEHPEGSSAWPTFRLVRPRRGEWLRAEGRPGWATEVDQAAYGHRARKRTWLYYVGNRAPRPLDWSERAGEAYISVPRAVREGRVSRETIKYVTRGERYLTPVPFAALLIELARDSAERPLVGAACRGCGRSLPAEGRRRGPRRATCGDRCRARLSRLIRGRSRPLEVTA